MKRMLEHINTCFVTPNSGYQKPDEEDFGKRNLTFQFSPIASTTAEVGDRF